MQTTSLDGTTIGFSTLGDGAPVIIVDGALCFRGLGPSAKLARALAARGFTAVTYDRRGRGESADAGAWTIEREVEDIDALIRAVGGSAALFGISSGAVLALEAGRRLDSVTGVVAFEAPLAVTDAQRAEQIDALARVDAHVDAGDPGAAVRTFLTLVGMPGPLVRLMPVTPMWRRMRSAGAGLPRDLRIVSQPDALTPTHWEGVRAPVLTLAGGKSDQRMQQASIELAAAVPGARQVTVPGADHMARATVLAPVVASFLHERAEAREHAVGDREAAVR